MENIRCEIDGRILVVTLARGKANALNSKMIDELTGAVSQARSDSGIRGVVIASASPRFFSAGFDVAEVFGYDRPKMHEFFGNFIGLYEGLYRLPKPVVAAIGGHAYAGGAVLGLTADYRVMAVGDYGFALNEINLGIALPPGIIRMAIDAVGYRNACELLLTGKSVFPNESPGIGLASTVVKPILLVDRALEVARELGDKAPGAFAAIKTKLRALAGSAAATTDRQELDRFLDSWFSPEAEERKRALIESLRH
jgi:enoyl-CoA hydratase/carnithine racemase